MSADASPQPVPQSALAEPVRRVGPLWITGLVLVNVGINTAFFGPIQVLLGLQALAFDPSQKEAILALVTGAGAAVALVANPLFGAFSDRTWSRFGRRRPWVLIGAVLGTIALVALAGAPNVAVATALWCLVQAGCNGAYAAITAAIPDRAPVEQRGIVGGLAAMGQTAGILLGAVIAAVVAGSFALGYVICAVALLAGVMLYLTTAADDPLPRAAVPPFSFRGFFASFWVSPARYPDFGWAWITRLLVNIGNHMVTLYLLFFLGDAVRLKQTVGIDPATGVLILTGLYAVFVIVTSVIGGSSPIVWVGASRSSSARRSSSRSRPSPLGSSPSGPEQLWARACSASGSARISRSTLRSSPRSFRKQATVERTSASSTSPIRSRRSSRRSSPTPSLPTGADTSRSTWPRP